MGVVHVSHLESRAVTAQTTRSEGRHTALVGDLRQRVLLVHELGQGVGTEIRVDDRRDRLRIDQVGRREDLVVADVHTLTNGAGHTSQTDTELVEELLADGADTTVREVVDIVHLGVGVDEHDEVLDDLDHVLLGQDACVIGDRHVELAVDAVTAYLAQVITLLGEEEVLDHLTRRSIIGRLRVTELTVDIEDSLFLGLSRVFLQGVEDDGEVVLALLVLVEEDGFRTGLHDDVDDLRSDLRLTLHDDLVTLDRRYLTGILIDEILDGGLHDVSREFAADASLEGLPVDLHLLGEVETVEDVLVGLEADSTQQGRHGQFLLTVDVSIHDLVDIRRELDPRTAEGDDTRRIELRSVGVHGCSEEDTRRTVKLRYDDTLGTVDDEGAFWGHIGDHTQIDRLLYSLELLVLRVIARKLQLSFQGDTIGQTTLDALLDGVARRVDVVVQKLKCEIVAGIRNGEVFLENLEKTLIQAVVRVGFNLEEILKRFQLNVQEIRIVELADGCEINYCGLIFCQGMKNLKLQNSKITYSRKHILYARGNQSYSNKE